MIPPRKVLRPAFAKWRWDRNLNLRNTAALIEAAAFRLGFEGFSYSDEAVRLICLPFGDPRRQEPSGDTLAAIESLTDFEIGAADFQPPPQMDAAA